MPWYTLPELNTIAPESIVRNLLIGQRWGKEFGCGMATGYTATSYGQISQMPQIYHGFGCMTAMSYRGTDSTRCRPSATGRARTARASTISAASTK